MEIKITVTVEGVEPIEVKVDIPEKEYYVDVKTPTNNDIYTVKFCDGCLGWSKHPESNKMFLLQQQNYANEKLRAQGYLFLNDVYEMLGIPKTAYGQVVGWIYNVDNPIGDNYVDFDLWGEQNNDFINGNTTDAILNFNVDGDILKYL